MSSLTRIAINYDENALALAQAYTTNYPIEYTTLSAQAKGRLDDIELKEVPKPDPKIKKIDRITAFWEGRHYANLALFGSDAFLAVSGDLNLPINLRRFARKQQKQFRRLVANLEREKKIEEVDKLVKGLQDVNRWIPAVLGLFVAVKESRGLRG